ncbi:PilZ domain-containing protein [Aestuariirhabdus litorea]|uniref:PilZ domain-containing protein n=1 Tax=Aestuariirhabdus litorea TaxID=2528527 RepID=A0A3P3VN36_9GAMM|nr:PilZ domain-containing protein [Aestuariirhabdus litorea]RRJ84115.1 PilZ domain-containing protein [Aestuariirhabdus litorea]RWW97335.1 PilZ domain-containing protein [Endozoicomonadaceae bacterium GTF-13]
MKTVQENKRFQDRLNRSVEVYVELPDHLGDVEIVLCETLDISPAGFRMNIQDPLPTAVVLDVCADFDGERYFLKGEVKWQHKVGDILETGMELYDAIDSDFDRWQQLFQNDTP